MISEKYGDIQCIAIPAVEKNFPNIDGSLHHERAASHISRKVKKVIEEPKLYMLQWSWNFLDLNLIKNVWGVVTDVENGLFSQ
jgi:hypothetical protein